MVELAGMMPNAGSWTMTSPVLESWGVGSDYRVKVSDNLATFGWSEGFTLEPQTPVRSQRGSAPMCFSLNGVFPNPSDGKVTVVFQVPETADVDILVHGLIGRLITHESFSGLTAGQHDAVIDNLQPGLFFVRIECGALQDCARAVVLP